MAEVRRSPLAARRYLASALISGAWGYIVLQGNLSTIWPIFGVSNQLLAIITLAISTVVICAMGKARFAWVTIIPWAFLTVVIFWADYLTFECSARTRGNSGPF